MAKNSSPYKSLSAERRLALLTHALTNHKGTRATYIQRLVARGGGFRAATLFAWSSERLAKEILRLNTQTPQDELDLLQLLYVDMEPQYQITFLDTAGVPHENGVIQDDLTAPYASDEAVEKAAMAVMAAHGENGMLYLRTLVVYNLVAWPGLEKIMTMSQSA